eukprot:jgi/Hompol1/4553/HPOL_000109-RA
MTKHNLGVDSLAEVVGETGLASGWTGGKRTGYLLLNSTQLCAHRRQRTLTERCLICQRAVSWQYLCIERRKVVEDQGVEQQVPQFLVEILSNRDLREHVLLETLGCLRNLIANQDTSKQAVLAIKSPGPFDSLLKIARSDTRSVAVFSAVMQVFKILVLDRSARTALVKMGLCTEILKGVDVWVRARDIQRLEDIVMVLVNTTYAADGQVSLMRVQGITAISADLLAMKSVSLKCAVMALLRNLALLKENKAFLLTDGKTNVID